MSLRSTNAPETGTRTEKARARSEVRPEIQVLRAVAVAVVVIYHLWPETLRGGFVGVDIFFAISGFLICAHLMRELERTGRIRVLQFWARRARRLLPASMLVLAVSVVGTLVLVPQNMWQQFFREIGGSALYIQNWVLAGDSVDYLAADNDPSPVQHFWSLSVEEQFYLVWPLLILIGVGLAAVFSRRVGAHSPGAAVHGGTTHGATMLTPVARRTVFIILSLLTASSFAFSIWLTIVEPPAAYFNTATRAWEFGAGALLAMLAPTVIAGFERLRSVVSWAGWIAIAASVVFYTEELPFPSYTAALPVIGTLLVIWAGTPKPLWSPTFITRVRPIQWLGDVSYSTYLWHWPLIIFISYYLGYNIDGPKSGAVVIVGSLVLAWLTKKFVEDPGRTGAFLARAKPRRTFIAMALVMAALVGVCFQAGSVVVSKEEANLQLAVKLLAQDGQCMGAESLTAPEGSCDLPQLEDVLVPDPLLSKAASDIYRCEYTLEGVELHVCDLEPEVTDPDKVVALIGDSHALHLRTAMAKVARELNWKIINIAHQSCMYADVVRKVEEPRRTECLDWQEDVDAWLAEHTEVDYLISANLSNSEVEVPDGVDDWYDTAVDGYISQWNEVPDNIQHIFVIRDNPRFPKAYRRCLEKEVEAGSSNETVNAECSVPRDVALYDDAQVDAAKKYDSDFVSTIDTTDVYCDDDACWPTLGHVMIYRDNSHITDVFSQTLAGRFEKELTEQAAEIK